MQQTMMRLKNLQCHHNDIENTLEEKNPFHIMPKNEEEEGEGEVPRRRSKLRKMKIDKSIQSIIFLLKTNLPMLP